jgi:hypothetical protein
MGVKVKLNEKPQFDGMGVHLNLHVIDGVNNREFDKVYTLTEEMMTTKTKALRNLNSLVMQDVNAEKSRTDRLKKMEIAQIRVEGYLGTELDLSTIDLGGSAEDVGGTTAEL